MYKSRERFSVKKRIVRGISFVLVCCMLITLLPINFVTAGYREQEEITVTSGFTTTPMISAGFRHTVALKNDGTVWAWGHNTSGQLGDGTRTNHSTPVQVQNLNSVTAISAGQDYTIALRSDGTVWAWGSNASGKLGVGGFWGSSSTPLQVENLNGITAISAGVSHTVALRSDGTVWVRGSNSSGELGDGTRTSSTTPVQAENLSNMTAISTSGSHTIALRNDGTVWAWGNNFD